MGTIRPPNGVLDRLVVVRSSNGVLDCLVAARPFDGVLNHLMVVGRLSNGGLRPSSGG